MPDPIPVASSYTPAAGYHFLTPFYDFGIAVTTAYASKATAVTRVNSATTSARLEVC